METKWKKWGLGEKKAERPTSRINIKGIANMLKENVSRDDQRPTIHLALGDPSSTSCFQASPAAEEALIEAIRSAKFNCYPPSCGVPSARRAVADYLSRHLPYRLSPEDVYITAGCKAAIETILSALAHPGANILLPRPGFSRYDDHASFRHLEVRHYDLLPEKAWEVDLNIVEALADDNTVAMVIINPGNPCSNVFSYQHLQNIAETARRLMIPVITDEAYGHLAYGKSPFIPMGVFGATVPVITVGSISKRWMVPGWRLGWLVTNDPTGFFLKAEVVDSIKRQLYHSSDPATFIQGAIPDIIEKTPQEFFSRHIERLKEASEICYARIKDIPCLTCPCKPEGSMFVMVKIKLSVLEDIKDDMEFCVKLAKEESVIFLPGAAVGLKNWLRITFAAKVSVLEDGLQRVKAFCQRHAKQQ